MKTLKISSRSAARLLLTACALMLTLVVVPIGSASPAPPGAYDLPSTVTLDRMSIDLTQFNGVACTNYPIGSLTTSLYPGDTLTYSSFTLYCGDVRLSEAFTVTASTATKSNGRPQTITVSNRLVLSQRVGGYWYVRNSWTPAANYSVPEGWSIGAPAYWSNQYWWLSNGNGRGRINFRVVVTE